MNKRKHAQTGFTLIELLIAVAIAALLVALAVPAYSDYSIRAKIGECVNAAAVPKVNISEHYMSSGVFPSTAQAAGIAALVVPQLSKYCESFEYQGGGLGPAVGNFGVWIDTEAVGLPSALTLHVEFYPDSENSGNVNWQCTRGNTPAWAVRFLPASCRSEYVAPVT